MSFTLKEIDGKYGQLLNETFTNEIRKGYVLVNETVVNKIFLDFAEAILNFEVRNDDIWVCSFPKAGTTWVQEMVWLIANDLDYEGAKEELSARSPFFEFCTLGDFRSVKKDNIISLLKIDSINIINNLKSPRIIKSHLPWNLLPLQIQYGSKHPKIVYVTRNPKDVCTSHFYHSKRLEGFKGTFEQFWELFLDGKLVYAPFWSNVLPFWERRNEPNILFLKYEDMKKDLSFVVRRVSKFFGKQLDDQQTEKLLDHLSFESMKNNEVKKITKSKGKFSEGHFRKGVIGSYRDDMPEEVIIKFDEWTKENTEGTGLTFDEN